MTDKPKTHGFDHRPGGFDPTPAGSWHYVQSSASAWDSGTNYSPGDEITDGTFIYLCMSANRNVEPGVNANWANFWVIDTSLFQGTWNNYGGSKQPMRFRLNIGPPHYLDKDNGSITSYADHEVLIQGSVAGGTSGSIIFVLPPAYQPSNFVYLHSNDDTGSFVTITVQNTGEVISGFV